ncbi:hypothetical protein [Bdellovibrio sp. HCB288]|uniref:hypothetical protein n=1 Tax=Bdellovibrio sp. HCB288 TaxID=3394355 RepID=UPI0039B4423F
MATNKFIESTLSLPYPKGSHIYFLLRGETVVYIGKSDSLLARIGTHSKDKEFDGVKYFPVDSVLQAELELALIKTFRPEYNVQKVSKLTDREMSMLRDYNLTEEILRGIALAQPKVQQYHWGHVAFLDQDGKLQAGYYDNDECRQDDEHDDHCPYIEVKEILEEVDDDLDLLLISKCTCTDFAVVRMGFHGVKMLHLEDLYDIGGPEFEVLRNRYSTKFKEEFEALKEAN